MYWPRTVAKVLPHPQHKLVHICTSIYTTHKHTIQSYTNTTHKSAGRGKTEAGVAYLQLYSHQARFEMGQEFYCRRLDLTQEPAINCVAEEQ